MPYHRPTLTKKAALKFLPYFEILLTQMIERSTDAGMFLATKDFGDIGVQTLQVRFSDALLWLTRHNIDDTTDRRGDFQHLKACVKNKREADGLRIFLYQGPRPESTVRQETEIKSVSTWKAEVEEFLADDDRKVGVFEKIILTGEELDYVKRITTNICGPLSSASVMGDKLIISKTA